MVSIQYVEITDNCLSFFIIKIRKTLDFFNLQLSKTPNHFAAANFAFQSHENSRTDFLN